MISIRMNTLNRIPFVTFRRHNDVLFFGQDTNFSVVVLDRSVPYVAMSDMPNAYMTNRFNVKDFADMVKMMGKVRRARINLQPVGRLVLRSGKKRRHRVAVNASQF